MISPAHPQSDRVPGSSHLPRWHVPALLCSVALCVALAGFDAQAETAGDADRDYERLLQENPEYREELEALETTLAQDPEAEESFLAYQDSVDAYPELAKHEAAYYKTLAEDSLLAARAAELEDAAAADPQAEAQMAAFDSLMASDQGLAERMEAFERVAAEDAEGFEVQAEAIAAIQSDPNLAEEIFSHEAGPIYSGAAAQIIVCVDYLRAHPRLYRAWWQLHHYAWTRPALARSLHNQWLLWHPRRALWRSWWRYRLSAAHNHRVHRIVWARRAWLGKRPWLARGVWRHRLVVARRPALRQHAWFHHRHPQLARRVIHHRHALRPHPPHGVKPAATKKRAPPPKPKPKPPPPPPRRR